MDRYVGELIVVEAELAARLGDHTGYHAIQAITGVGPIMAAIFVTEIGDVSRFPVRAASVLVGRAHTVAQRVRHEGATGAITKQGNHLVRWTAIEAVARYKVLTVTFGARPVFGPALKVAVPRPFTGGKSI